MEGNRPISYGPRRLIQGPNGAGETARGRGWSGGNAGREHLDLPPAVGLAAAVALAYARILHNSLVNFDDPLYVSANPVTQKGLSASGVARAFATGFVQLAPSHPVLRDAGRRAPRAGSVGPPLGSFTRSAPSQERVRGRGRGGQSRAGRSREAG
jgi:hypothetical protein